MDSREYVTVILMSFLNSLGEPTERKFGDPQRSEPIEDSMVSGDRYSVEVLSVGSRNGLPNRRIEITVTNILKSLWTE